MRRLVFAILASSLLLTLAFVQKGNIPAVEAPSSIRQGDLILTGNTIYTIENRRFDINGSIIVEQNATLRLKNAFLNFTQTESSQFNITLRNPLNGNPRLLAYSSTITSEFWLDTLLFANSTATIDNSTISWALCAMESSILTVSNSSYVYYQVGYDDSVTNIQNSTIESWWNYRFPECQAYNSTIDHLSIAPRTVNCTVSNLEPGYVNYWNFIANCSVTFFGDTPLNMTLVNTTINKWGFEFYSLSNAMILNSNIWNVGSWGGSVTYLKTTDCALARTDSKLSINDSSINQNLVIFGGECWLLNSSYLDLVFYGLGNVYVSWYLDVHVIDSIGQNVPSATVTASYPNATLADSKLTGANGWARFTLMEKMMNASENYTFGNYTVKATYGAYSSNTTVNMTGNQQITLTLEGFVIPEFSSFIILPLFMIATLLAVIVHRRKHST